MIHLIDRLVHWARRTPLLYRFTWFNRILLAAAFIPTGSVKLMGERFTTMGVETPIGAFFEAMFQTGLFWQFIGLSQVIAGILLLVPRLSHLGAALFFPIILNIVIITVGLGFNGTTLITIPMLLSITWLCLWDFHRFRGLFSLEPSRVGPLPEPRLEKIEAMGFAVFAASLLGFFSLARGFGPGSLGFYFIVLGCAAGVSTLGRFLWLKKSGRLSPSPTSP